MCTEIENVIQRPSLSSQGVDYDLQPLDATMEWQREAFLFLESTTNRKKYSEAAFRIAKNYSLEKRIAQWIEALQLTDACKSKPATELAFTKISHLFYLELIKKNIRYFTRLPFSATALVSAIHYFFKRIV